MHVAEKAFLASYVVGFLERRQLQESATGYNQTFCDTGVLRHKCNKTL